MDWELLSPAGDLERVRAAIRFGADAVYVGGPMMQLRAASAGFRMEDLRAAVALAHAAGRRLYVTVNAFLSDRETEALPDYAQALSDMGVDAVIVSDLGAIAAIRRAADRLPVHVSTQANCQNAQAARVYADLGCKRVVLARELSIEDIAGIRARVPSTLELEAFVHGAMCMAYSGRCLISAFLTGRSANRGACTQPCRWKYALTEEKRPGQYFPVEEDANGTTVLSSCDLRAIGFLEQLHAAGVSSFKIEGRMKSVYYVAAVTRAYRMRMDALAGGAATSEQLQALMDELETVSHRPYSDGFYFGGMKHHAPDDGVYRQSCAFVGVVRRTLDDGRIEVEVRNRIPEGARVEVVTPDALGRSFVPADIRDAEGQPVPVADRPSECYTMEAGEGLSPGDLLRIRLENA